MIVSIASGKGGTGKTTLAVNAALALGNVQLLDCDVEEPNCHLFLKHEIKESGEVQVKIPEIKKELCNYCGICSRFCRYNALAVSGKIVLFFPELCHSCGGCQLACPQKAITETERSIGVINHCTVEGMEFSYGLLNVGEAQASPVIRELKKHINKNKDVLIDAPPGTSCATISAVEGSDYCILVTEPTPFGLNDLKLAVGMLEGLGIPHGVVINQDGIGDDKVAEYCESKGIQILLRIPHDRRIAELYSNGTPFLNELQEYRLIFQDLFKKIKEVIE